MCFKRRGTLINTHFFPSLLLTQSAFTFHLLFLLCLEGKKEKEKKKEESRFLPRAEGWRRKLSRETRENSFAEQQDKLSPSSKLGVFLEFQLNRKVSGTQSALSILLFNVARCWSSVISLRCFHGKNKTIKRALYQGLASLTTGTAWAEIQGSRGDRTNLCPSGKTFIALVSGFYGLHWAFLGGYPWGLSICSVSAMGSSEQKINIMHNELLPEIRPLCPLYLPWTVPPALD